MLREIRDPVLGARTAFKGLRSRYRWCAVQFAETPIWDSKWSSSRFLRRMDYELFRTSRPPPEIEVRMKQERSMKASIATPRRQESTEPMIAEICRRPGVSEQAFNL